MDSAPIKEGKTVDLVLITREDLPLIQRWINDPETNRFLRNPGSLKYPEDEEAWYESLRKNSETDRVLLIRSRNEKRAVGVIGLHHMDSQSRHAELGYFIFRDSWKNGYASEAVSLMTEYAREEWNLRKVYAMVKDQNGASERVLEKDGFRNCGRFTRHDYVPGFGYADLLLYEKIF